MSRTKKTALNFLASMVFMVLSTGVNFAITPYVIQYIGNEGFGAVRMINDWFTYLSFLELGIESTLIALLNAAISQNQHDDTHGLARTGFRIYGYLTLVKVVIAVLFVTNIRSFIDVDIDHQSDLVQAGWFAVASLVFTVFVPFRAYLGAAQMSYAVKVFLLVQSLVISVLGLWFAWAGWGVAGQLMAGWIAYCLFYVGIALITLKQWPVNEWASFIWRGPTVTLQGHVRTLALPNLVIDISLKLAQMSDNIIVGTILSPEAVVPLFVSQRLANVGQRILQEISGASWASLGHLFHAGEGMTFNRRVIELTKITMTLACIGLFPILGLNEALVRLWVGPHQFGGHRLTSLVVLNAFFIAVGTLWRWTFLTTGKARALAPITAVETGIYATISLLATWKLGIIGPPLGATLAFSCTGLWFLPRQMENHFGTSAKSVISGVIRPILVLGPVAILLAVLNRFFPVKTWLDLGVAFTTELIVLAFTAYALVLTAEERRLWRERIHHLRQRNPHA